MAARQSAQRAGDCKKAWGVLVVGLILDFRLDDSINR